MGAAGSVEANKVSKVNFGEELIPQEYHNLSGEQQNIIIERINATVEGNPEISHEDIVKRELHLHKYIGDGVKFIELTELNAAIDAARSAGLTPLILDSSEDSKVDTFFSYRSAVLLDGKKMGLDKSMRKIPVIEVIEGAREKLVSALKLGYPLVIAMTKSATDFATTFNDEALPPDQLQEGMSYFPKEVFLNSGRELLKEEWMKKLFREKELEHGMAISRSPDTFQVIMTSNFSHDSYHEYLFSNDYGLVKPESQYQVYSIKYE